MSTHNLNFISLTETWLDKNGAITLFETAPPNFCFIHTIRSDKRGGGIAAVFV